MKLRKRREYPAKKFYKACLDCEGFLPPYAIFCPICGRHKPKMGGMTTLRYPAITLNEYGKAIVCPHCENEELTPGNFCIICGSDIVNRCSDCPDRNAPSITVKGCGETLLGNARYCYKCGNQSSFYKSGWLPDWQSENTRKAIRNASSGTVVDMTEIRRGR